MPTKAVLLIATGLFLVGAAACGANATPTATAAPTIPPTLAPTQVPTETATVAPTATENVPEVARPSNPGGPGPAIDLKGDAVAGKKIFVANCVICHAQEGKGAIPNPGSDDGTIPALNPIDDTIKSADYRTFATNIDLFVEHGSTPAGASPVFSMPNWGESGKLTPQQIADVITYVISLNK